MRPTEKGALALAFLAYAAMAVWVTWPLASAPSRLGLPNMDVYGNMWTIAWVNRQARLDPLHLFDSNMFFPWTKSLAYAESLLPQSVQAAPILAVGGSLLFAYNVVFLLTFALSGLGAYVLARDLSGSRDAGLLAGLAFGFFSYRWDHAVHLQSLSTQWLPFALVFARRAVREGRRAQLLGLAGFSLLQLLSSGYYAMLVALAVALVLVCEWRFGRAPLRRLGGAAAALAFAAALALPVFLQHRAVQSRHGFTRGRAESVAWSARFASYLEPGPWSDRPHLVALSGWARDGEPLYPGAWALGFGMLGLSLFGRSREAQLAGLWLTAGLLLSLGPVVSLFGWSVPGPFEFIRLLPGGGLLRTPARLGVLAVLGLDVLAALAWARFVAPRPWHRLWLGLAFIAAAFEGFPGELRGAVREMPRPSAAALWLSGADRGPVLELPWSVPADCALYLYWSTAHWQPMVNGFASFDPPDNFGLGLLGNRWPSEYSARVFRGRGIRYVVVHLDRLKPAHRQRLEAAALPTGVRLAATLGEDRVYLLEIESAAQKEKPSETEGFSPTSR